jgi:hypothetical protein
MHNKNAIRGLFGYWTLVVIIQEHGLYHQNTHPNLTGAGPSMDHYKTLLARPLKENPRTTFTCTCTPWYRPASLFPLLPPRTLEPASELDPCMFVCA